MSLKGFIEAWDNLVLSSLWPLHDQLLGFFRVLGGGSFNSLVVY